MVYYGISDLIIDVFTLLLSLSLSLILSSKLPIGILSEYVVYLSVVYLQMPATVTAKVTN